MGEEFDKIRGITSIN
uniref:Uncharacterized protein n=2 Tax=Vitis vinifera TaxID=29760 RepID=F6I6J5_VITVI